jgi:hypothetical protein
MGINMKKRSGERNSDRPNGKAWKKKPKSNRKTDKTVGGYTAAKIAIRKGKRVANV